MKYRVIICSYSWVKEKLIYEVPFNIDSEELKDLCELSIFQLLEKDYKPIEIIGIDSNEEYEIYSNKKIKNK
jgi:hypothetical protein